MRRRVWAGALALVLAVGPAGCAASQPSARQWAASVCQALTPWRAEIRALNARAQQQMAAATTPAQAKENLLRLLGGGESASEAARAGVAKAGVPDVEGGDRVAQGFVRSLTGVRDAYGRARGDIEALHAGEAGPFYEAVATVLTRLNDEYAETGVDVTSIESVPVRQAFDEVPECH